MESKATSDRHTPGKLMQNILEKAVNGKFGYSFGADSPFRQLPTASTPPSRIVTIRNPFESQLTERLHQSVFSPSVFNNVQSLKTEEKFKWTIEEISSLKPADIDETTVEQFELTHDPEIERTAQANIEKYFSEKHIVPSPFDTALKTVPLISESTSPMKPEVPKEVTTSVAQTVLTLPAKLPEHIEAILKPYFSYTVDQQQDKNRNCSLYRKLFEFEDEQHSPSSVLTSPAPSCNLSPIEFSPLDENKSQSQRNFGSPHDGNRMSECNLSPIDLNVTEAQVPARSVSAVRLNFSEHMSVDTSLNLVPDTLNQMPSNNQSLAFERTRSPVQEVLSNSSVNWDMEYKLVSLGSPKSQNSSENEMDVSTSNTPRSKIFTSQRKKLSDSFLKVEESDGDEENKENIYQLKDCIAKRIAKSNLFVRDDVTDGGYHTGYGLTMSEESWNSSGLFASTPTKH